MLWNTGNWLAVMCWMLGAAHHEYQYGVQQHGEAGSQIVAVRLKPLDFKANYTMGTYSRRQRALNRLLFAGCSYI